MLLIAIHLALRAINRRDVMDLASVTSVKVEDTVYVRGKVPRSMKRDPLVAMFSHSAQTGAMLGGRCFCVAGSAMHLCCHIVTLVLAYREIRVTPASTTDGPNMWRPPRRQGAGKVATATQAFYDTMQDRLPGSEKRRYDRGRQRADGEAYAKKNKCMLAESADAGMLAIACRGLLNDLVFFDTKPNLSCEMSQVTPPPLTSVIQE